MEGKAFKIIAQELNKLVNDSTMEIQYAQICACAQELLDEYLGEDYNFPIDLEKLVEKIGINVIYQPLNGLVEEDGQHVHRVVGRNLKRQNFVTKELVSSILIDDESNRAEQRYALAHELAHFLIHQEEKTYNSEYYVMPMLFKNMEEMIADCFASFLLIPIPLFIKEFAAYIGGQPVPVKTSEWLRYLSVLAEVDYENVAIGYQTIRYVCGYAYGVKKQREKAAEEQAESQVENRVENQEAKKKSEIFERQLNRIIDAISDPEAENLFC